MKQYRRRPPHIHPDGADFFVTWRLFGTLPSGRRGEAFAESDHRLDLATDGPLFMKDPEVAASVSRVLLAGDSDWHWYELLAWVVMANHVHVLLRPRTDLTKLVMNVKSASARRCNALLGRVGQPFWQEEAYDHWVRNDRERNSIIDYIEFNPVKAGLVAEPADWPWSSAGWKTPGGAWRRPTGQ